MAEKDVTVVLDEARVDYELLPHLGVDLAHARVADLFGDRRGRRGTWPRI